MVSLLPSHRILRFPYTSVRVISPLFSTNPGIYAAISVSCTSPVSDRSPWNTVPRLISLPCTVKPYALSSAPCATVSVTPSGTVKLRNRTVLPEGSSRSSEMTRSAASQDRARPEESASSSQKLRSSSKVEKAAASVSSAAACCTGKQHITSRAASRQQNRRFLILLSSPFFSSIRPRYTGFC